MGPLLNIHTPVTADDILEAERHMPTRKQEPWESQEERKLESTHDDHLSKIELKSGPQAETQVETHAGVTLCSSHKICQRFKCKVEEARTLQPEGDTVTGGPNSSIKNSESKMFGALYDEF